MQAMCSTKPKIGAAIAVCNGRENLKHCLLAGRDQWDVAVVLDDASTDGTPEMLATEFPDVVHIRGDGNQWWTGGTNRAVEKCLDLGCDFILLLNPDAFVEAGTVSALLQNSLAKPGTISAALVVFDQRPDTVWWAGSTWGCLYPPLPIYASRYLHRAGTSVAAVPSCPFDTDEAHGRAVLVPAQVFRNCGLFDEATFPHYAADSDFSFRVRSHGIRIQVVPTARVRLRVESSGMHKARLPLQGRAKLTWNYLTKRKNGDALRIWWAFLNRHAPAHAVLPSYMAIVGRNLYRRLVP